LGVGNRGHRRFGRLAPWCQVLAHTHTTGDEHACAHTDGDGYIHRNTNEHSRTNADEHAHTPAPTL
jgi:hypothetical protein